MPKGTRPLIVCSSFSYTNVQHVMVVHTAAFMRLYGSLKQFCAQGSEGLNSDLTATYFRGTNRRKCGTKCPDTSRCNILQAIIRDLRLQFARNTPNVVRENAKYTKSGKYKGEGHRKRAI